ANASTTIHRQIARWTFAARISSHAPAKEAWSVAMKSSLLLAGLSLLSLAGCSAVDPSIFAFASDDMQKRTTQRQTAPRQKIQLAKNAQTPRSARHLRASDPTFPAWSVPSPKPSTVLQSTLTPVELFTKVSPAVYALSAEGQLPQRLTSQGSAVA